MPSLVTRPRCMPLGSSTAPALVVALVATVGASPLGAQAPTTGTDINAAAETERDRAPLFFGSALVVPKGYFSISLLGTGGSGDRTLPMPGGPGTEYLRAWGSTMSAVWGATPRLTLGAQVGVGGTRREYEWSSPLEAGGPSVAQRGESFQWATPSVRVHARYLLLEQGDGATRLALSSSLLTPSRYDRTVATVGLALSQRVGRVSFHLAPDVRIREGEPLTRWEVDAQGADALRLRTSLDVRTAMVVPITRRVSWSLEGIGTNVLAPAATYEPRLFELGTGFRFDLGRVKLDLGYREQLYRQDFLNLTPKRQVVLGTHWKF